MSVWQAAALLVAATVAGAINAVAGGGSLITFPALVPGATYRVARWEKDTWVPHKEFKVESGKTVDLGDIVIDKGK